MSETQPPAELPKTPSQPVSPESNAPDRWINLAAYVQKNLTESLFSCNHMVKNCAENYLRGDPRDQNPAHVEWKFNHLRDGIDSVSGQTAEEIVISTQRLIDQIAAPLALIKTIADVYIPKETNKFDDQIKPLFDQLLQSSTVDQASDLAGQIKSAVQAEVIRLTERAKSMDTSSTTIESAASQEFEEYYRKHPPEGLFVTSPNSPIVLHNHDLQAFKEDTQRSGAELKDSCQIVSKELVTVADPVSQFLGEYLQSKYPETK